MKPKTKNNSSRKTKLKRIMFEQNIQMNELHEGTGVAYPTLFNIEKGRKTTPESFRKRTLRDLEKFLTIRCGKPVTPDQFIGWEENGIAEKTPS